MKIAIKNYSDLCDILETGTHKVLLGNDEAHLGSLPTKVPTMVLDEDPKKFRFKKTFVEVDKEYLILEKEMAWNLTMSFVRDNFHTMKDTFYVEIETTNEKVAKRRTQLQEEYVKATTEEEKAKVIRKMMNVNRIYVNKSITCLYNEAKGIFTEARI